MLEGHSVSMVAAVLHLFDDPAMADRPPSVHHHIRHELGGHSEDQVTEKILRCDRCRCGVIEHHQVRRTADSQYAKPNAETS